MTRPTRPALLLLGLGGILFLLPLAYGSDGESRIRARERSLDLPQGQHAYAAPALPNHFDRRVLRRFDNTPSTNPMTDERALLGRVLFYDTRLSANDRMSCATCHLQTHAFSDPRRVSTGIHGHRGRRNSMSLVNLRYQARGGFFWDERAASLEEQVLMPIEDPTEMAFEVDQLVERLGDDPTYGALFQYAFGSPVVTRERVAQALATFVRAIVSYRSRFDEGMRQTDSVSEDFANFSKLENEGKRVFFGLDEGRPGASCASCHVPGVRRDGPGPPAETSARSRSSWDAAPATTDWTARSERTPASARTPASSPNADSSRSRRCGTSSSPRPTCTTGGFGPSRRSSSTIGVA